MLRAAVIPVTPFQQNCAILWDEADRRGLVVDPGGEAVGVRTRVIASAALPTRRAVPLHVFDRALFSSRRPSRTTDTGRRPASRYWDSDRL
jgi:glyoxylase-like metal-dependent hydrolase (beta-lactamase superfamily II)